MLQVEHTPQQAHSSATHIICKSRFQTLANIQDGVASRAAQLLLCEENEKYIHHTQLEGLGPLIITH